MLPHMASCCIMSTLISPICCHLVLSFNFMLAGVAEDETVSCRPRIQRMVSVFPEDRRPQNVSFRSPSRPDLPRLLCVLAHFDSGQSCFVPETWTGTAEKNPLPKDYREHLARFIPVLQSYNLHDAATHFRQWLDGELPLAPLLDVSGPLGLQNYGILSAEHISHASISLPISQPLSDQCRV